jgi:hypothetical protein
MQRQVMCLNSQRREAYFQILLCTAQLAKRRERTVILTLFGQAMRQIAGRVCPIGARTLVRPRYIRLHFGHKSEQYFVNNSKERFYS